MNTVAFQLPNLREGKLRVVYLRPRIPGDEAIALGVLFHTIGSVQLINIEAPAAYDTLRILQSDAVVEDVLFGLALLKQKVKTSFAALEEFESPVSNIFFGNAQAFLSEEPAAYVREYLRMVSTLMQERIKRPERTIVNQSTVGDVLFNEASQIDVIAATRLFEGYKLQLSRGRTIKFPIYGRKIIAAPVSMLTKQINAAKNLAEAHCAKLSLAGKVVDRKAMLYVLVPPLGGASSRAALDDALGEIDFIAEGSDVTIRVEKDPSELARAIVYDDKG